jgi:hypothetical protein
MNDEWRLQVDPHDPSHTEQLKDRLEAHELEHDLSSAFQDRIIVSRDGARLFVYAGSREQVEGARDLIGKLAERHGWRLDLDLRCWHPAAEEWEDPDRPLPDGADAERAERADLMARERKQAEERGYPEFEVRIDLGSHHDAASFAKRLQDEGIPTVHRWRFVLVGAADEDSAKALAERIRSEAPDDSRVKVEGTWKVVHDERPPNPFAFLGGLAA